MQLKIKKKLKIIIMIEHIKSTFAICCLLFITLLPVLYFSNLINEKNRL
jgi:hypothetical protein